MLFFLVIKDRFQISILGRFLSAYFHSDILAGYIRFPWVEVLVPRCSRLRATYAPVALVCERYLCFSPILPLATFTNSSCPGRVRAFPNPQNFGCLMCRVSTSSSEGFPSPLQAMLSRVEMSFPFSFFSVAFFFYDLVGYPVQ